MVVIFPRHYVNPRPCFFSVCFTPSKNQCRNKNHAARIEEQQLMRQLEIPEEIPFPFCAVKTKSFTFALSKERASATKERRTSTRMWSKISEISFNYLTAVGPMHIAWLRSRVILCEMVTFPYSLEDVVLKSCDSKNCRIPLSHFLASFHPLFMRILWLWMILWVCGLSTTFPV